MITKQNTLLFKHTKLVLFMAFVLFSSLGWGQQLNHVVDPNINKPFNSDFCGTDFFHNEKMKNDEAYRMRHLKSVEDIKKIASKTFNKSGSGVTQIPVVVHVMHKGESVGTGTNISDEDVKRGIQYLNNYWRKVSNSPGFGDGVDMKIEFTLAIQDPTGNCTNGIDRVNMSGVTAYVNNGVNTSAANGISDYDPAVGVNSLKEYSIWEPNHYYNVWLVDEIDNANCYSGSYTAGYAYYAWAHGQPYDGSVVLICSYLRESDVTWAHEMGHAFNLPHTFDGDNINLDQCGDDSILDTPQHKRTSSISPSIYFSCNSTVANACDPTFNKVINPDTGFTRNSGTVQDHMHNYMDYTGCPTEFTGGQRTVVTAALTTRASYLAGPALTPTAPATVFFKSLSTNVCSGNSLQFIDESTCTPNTFTNSSYTGITFLWTFNNNVNTPFTSTLQNPLITFTNPGLYDVTLAVTNSTGTTSLTKYGTVTYGVYGVASTCALSSAYNNYDYGIGVTKVSLNSINNVTSTFIPANAMNDFSCSKNTTVFVGNSYPLTVNYQSRPGGNAYLEVWIDWNNNGNFETLNSLGLNERVLTNNIPASSSGSPTVSIIPPANAVLNTILRMRVVTEFTGLPTVCGAGYVQRADDYGVLVKALPTTTTWNATTWSNGTPTASIDAIIDGTYTTTPNGVFTAKTLTVNANKTFTINSGHNITVAGAVTNNGTFNVANNANLVQTDVTATNSGSINVYRNSASIQLYDYTLWSSPVAGQKLKAFSPNTLDTRFYTYNSGTNFYNVVNSPSTTDFATATGYLIRASNYHPTTPTVWNGVFTGVPNNGTLSKALNYTDDARSFNLVGNPYPSPINIWTLVNENSANIESTLYFWRKTNGSVGQTSAYCTFVPGALIGGTGTFTTNSNSQSFNPLGVIQTGQGFFVKAKSGATTLTFNNTQRVNNTVGQFFRTNQVAEPSKIWLNATNATGNFSQMAVTYFDGATIGVDAFDAKYINDSGYALTSSINDAEYTIQGRPSFDVSDVVALNFKTAAAGNYTIAIDHVEGLFSSGQTIFLKDNLLNTVVDLSAGSYSFASAIGTFNSRFEVVYQNTLAETNPTFTANSVIAYSANGEISINSGSTIMELVRVYDLQGRLLVEKKQINASETKLSTTATNQLLLVEITAANGSKITKKIIQ